MDLAMKVRSQVGQVKASSLVTLGGVDAAVDDVDGVKDVLLFFVGELTVVGDDITDDLRFFS